MDYSDKDLNSIVFTWSKSDKTITMTGDEVS